MVVLYFASSALLHLPACPNPAPALHSQELMTASSTVVDHCIMWQCAGHLQDWVEATLAPATPSSNQPPWWGSVACLPSVCSTWRPWRCRTGHEAGMISFAALVERAQRDWSLTPHPSFFSCRSDELHWPCSLGSCVWHVAPTVGGSPPVEMWMCWSLTRMGSLTVGCSASCLTASTGAVRAGDWHMVLKAVLSMAKLRRQ